MRTTALALAALALAACTDTTARWELDYDRIIAVRATPPAIPAGGRAAIDALVTTVAGVPRVTAPVTLELAPGAAVAVTLERTAEGWTLAAPAEADLAAARAARALPAGAPVEVQVVATFDLDGVARTATKTVRLGATGANPAVAIRVDGAPAGDPGAPIAVPLEREVELAAYAPGAAGAPDTPIDPDATDEIDWLTALGDLTDDDDPVAYLEITDPGAGAVVAVRRDSTGGVGWAVVQLETRDP